MRRRSPKRARGGGPWNGYGNRRRGLWGGPWSGWGGPPVGPGWRPPGGPWDPEDDLNLAEIEDPEDDLNLAEIEDPEDDLNLAEIEDPEDDLNLAEIEDPQFDRWGNPVVDPWGTVAVSSGGPSGPWGWGAPWGGGGCCCDESSEAKSGGTELAGCTRSGFIIVRLARSFDPGKYGSLFALAREKQLAGLVGALTVPQDEPSTPGARVPPVPPSANSAFPSWPLIDLGERQRHLETLETAAASGPWPPLHSLLDYWRIDLRGHLDRLESVRDRLQAENVVDLAYIEFEALDSSTSGLTGPSVSTLGYDQLHLGPAPDGIDARWARRWLGKQPSQVLVVDVEQSWIEDHRNLSADVVFPPFVGDNRAKKGKKASSHGVAVCGELVADPSGPGIPIEGIAKDVATVHLGSHYDEERGMNGNVANAIVAAITTPDGPLANGEGVLLLEVQRCRLPTEIDPADLDAIRLASSAGILVIEAAGNGGYDLAQVRDPEGRRSLAKGTPEFIDSGALLVGAAMTARPHNRLRSSNYGRAVGAWADGQRVVTCGYGDFFGQGQEEYLTDTFSGTSAASAIVAGAAVLLQSLSKQYFDEFLAPSRLREILQDKATGTRQGRGVPGHIGVMPDLRAILEQGLAWTPCPSMRKSPSDAHCSPSEGATRTLDVWSSPDILMVDPGKSVAPFLSGRPREHDPAPGRAWAPAAPKKVEVFTRLKNCGLLPAKSTRIDLFCAPPATWIDPRLWLRAGRTGTASIPSGGEMVASQGLPWEPPASVPRHYAWLAVLAEGVGQVLPELPPSGRYFDPRAYRDFLASKAVACRNVHRITQAGKVEFFVAGAPDRARSFDFEILQQLPTGSRVTLDLGSELGLKFQRGAKGHAVTDLMSAHLFQVTNQRRQVVRRVLLQPSAWYQVVLTVSGNPAAHHWFAIRQLYKGKPWGQITFYFQ